MAALCGNACLIHVLLWGLCILQFADTNRLATVHDIFVLIFVAVSTSVVFFIHMHLFVMCRCDTHIRQLHSLISLTSFQILMNELTTMMCCAAQLHEQHFVLAQGAQILFNHELG